MINFIVFRDNATIRGFSVSGHSDFLPRGSDIVCSAVSALAQTGILALENVAKVKPHWTRQDGHLECRIPRGLAPESGRAAQLVLKTIIIGITNIAQHYPRHVTVTDEEV